MKIRRTLPVKYRIITADDLCELIKAALEGASSDEDIRLFIDTETKTYEFESLEETFNLCEILKKQRVVRVHVSYYSKDKSIEIEIYQKNKGNILIRGEDKKWVYYKYKELEDLINGWQRYNRLVYMFSAEGAALAILSASIMGLLMLLLYFPVRKIFAVLNIVDSDEALKIIGLSIAWGIAMILDFYIFHLMEELFPIVEIQTGPEHLQYEKRKRKILWILSSIVIIPTILNLMFHVLF